MLGPEESVVDIRHILMNEKGQKHRRFFQILNGAGSE